MAAKNSKRDPEMIRAVEDLEIRLDEAANAVDVARDAWLQSPVWGGRGDLGTRYDKTETYPKLYAIDKGTSKSPVDLATAIDYHAEQQVALAKYLRDMGKTRDVHQWHRSTAPLPPTRAESPRILLDRVRRDLRYQEMIQVRYYEHHRAGLITVPFGLFTSKEVNDSISPYTGTHATIKEKDLKYKKLVWWVTGLPDAATQLGATLRGVQSGIRAAFDHAALALMPKADEVSDHDRQFLIFMRDRTPVSGEARNMDIVEWMVKAGRYQGRGIGVHGNGRTQADMGTMPRFTRRWCDKPGGPGRSPYILRPEAMALARTL